MQIGDFLHLQRAFQRHGIIRIAADEKEGLAGIASGKGGNLIVHIDRLLEELWQHFQGAYQRGILGFL